jgi:hypothetical protein
MNSVRHAQVEHKQERDRAIQTYHVAADPAGLKCPLCGRWSAIDFSSPQGVRLECGYDGVVAIMPRVPLARAIRRREKTR